MKTNKKVMTVGIPVNICRKHRKNINQEQKKLLRS